MRTYDGMPIGLAELQRNIFIVCLANNWTFYNRDIELLRFCTRRLICISLSLGFIVTQTPTSMTGSLHVRHLSYPTLCADRSLGELRYNIRH